MTYSGGNIFLLILLSSTVVVFGIFLMPFVVYSETLSPIGAKENNDKKVVILNFDDGYKSHFINAKPILDKYGYKASFYIVCKYVGKNAEEMNSEDILDFEGKGKEQMSWQDITELQRQGHNIGSHSMNHYRLNEISERQMQFEVGQSKKCLLDHSINATVFAYPFSEGWDDEEIVSTVSKYYLMARAGNVPLMFLHCNYHNNNYNIDSEQNDCRTYDDNGDLTFVNRYSIRTWSHDAVKKDNSYDNSEMFEKFVEVVNSQTKYNKDGKITSIPIVKYHKIDDSGEDYSTNVDLFSDEMRYLYDNSFTVLSMQNLGYDEDSNYLYIKDIK
jgi:peptidoglycan/xylan/chitin deacetylase (PgdA/CDA1 family)